MSWGYGSWGSFSWSVPASGPGIAIVDVRQRTVITGSGCSRKEYIDRSFLVDVIFQVSHASSSPLTFVSVEYSTDGITFLPATAQPLDFRHTANEPLVTSISPTTYIYVWNAFEDLPEGDFDEMYFRIIVEDSTSTQAVDTFTPFSITTTIIDIVEQKKRAGLNRKALQERSSLDFLGVGPIVPLRRGVRDFTIGSDVELVKSAIKQILNTRASSPDGNIVGEIPWRPEFGSQLWLLRHKNINDGTAILAESFITSAFEQEPRAVLQNIEIEELEDTTLSIKVSYGIINENIDANQVIITEVEELII